MELLAGVSCQTLTTQDIVEIVQIFTETISAGLAYISNDKYWVLEEVRKRCPLPAASRVRRSLRPQADLKDGVSLSVTALIRIPNVLLTYSELSELGNDLVVYGVYGAFGNGNVLLPSASVPRTEIVRIAYPVALNKVATTFNEYIELEAHLLAVIETAFAFNSTSAHVGRAEPTNSSSFDFVVEFHVNDAKSFWETRKLTELALYLANKGDFDTTTPSGIRIYASGYVEPEPILSIGAILGIVLSILAVSVISVVLIRRKRRDGHDNPKAGEKAFHVNMPGENPFDPKSIKGTVDYVVSHEDDQSIICDNISIDDGYIDPQSPEIVTAGKYATAGPAFGQAVSGTYLSPFTESPVYAVGASHLAVAGTTPMGWSEVEEDDDFATAQRLFAEAFSPKLENEGLQVNSYDFEADIEKLLKLGKSGAAPLVAQLASSAFDNIVSDCDRSDLILRCQSAINVPYTKVGLFARDVRDYERFDGLFMTVVRAIHKAQGHDSRGLWPAAGIQSLNLYRSGLGLVPIQLSLSRNLVGYTLPCAMSLNERIEAEHVIHEALLAVEMEYAGTYYSLTPSVSIFLIFCALLKKRVVCWYSLTG